MLPFLRYSEFCIHYDIIIAMAYYNDRINQQITYQIFFELNVGGILPLIFYLKLVLFLYIFN